MGFKVLKDIQPTSELTLTWHLIEEDDGLGRKECKNVRLNFCDKLIGRVKFRGKGLLSRILPWSYLKFCRYTCGQSNRFLLLPILYVFNDILDWLYIVKR